MLQYHLTTESEKAEISAWRYPGDYAIYDLPPYAGVVGTGRGLDNPKNRFYTFYDGARPVGFVNLADGPEEVFLGIGAAPDCCGQGYGRAMLAETCRIAETLFPGKPLYLEVRTWNERAVRCYQAAGFRIDGPAFRQTTPIGEGEFYRMVFARKGM